MKQIAATEPQRSAWIIIFIVAGTGCLWSGCSITQALPGWMKPGSESDGGDFALLMPYEEAVSVSRQTGKPVLLLFTGSDWCTWCVKLKQEVFQTEEFESWARDNVLMVELDFPQNRELSSDQQVLNDRLKRQYEDQLEGFPTALFVAADGRVIGKMGYEKGGPGVWIQKAEQVINAPAM